MDLTTTQVNPGDNSFTRTEGLNLVGQPANARVLAPEKTKKTTIIPLDYLKRSLRRA
jgi:hypothetical protein